MPREVPPASTEWVQESETAAPEKGNRGEKSWKNKCEMEAGGNPRCCLSQHLVRRNILRRRENAILLWENQAGAPTHSVLGL